MHALIISKVRHVLGKPRWLGGLIESHKSGLAPLGSILKISNKS